MWGMLSVDSSGWSFVIKSMSILIWVCPAPEWNAICGIVWLLFYAMISARMCVCVCVCVCVRVCACVLKLGHECNKANLFCWRLSPQVWALRMPRSSRTEEPWALHRLHVQHSSLACSIVRKGLPNGKQHPCPGRQLNFAPSHTTQPTRSALLWLPERRGSSRWCHQSWPKLGLMKVNFLDIKQVCNADIALTNHCIKVLYPSCTGPSSSYARKFREPASLCALCLIQLSVLPSLLKDKERIWFGMIPRRASFRLNLRVV